MPEQKKELRDWDSFEQIAKIASYILIPIMIAWGGWSIQKAIAQQSVSKDYVQIAVGILTQPKDNVDPEIRYWAVDLINATSPVKFNDIATAKLKSGEVTLLGACNQPPPSNPIGAVAEVSFVNDLASNVALSFSMINPNKQGECGSYSYSLKTNETTSSTVLVGCYFAYAWVLGDATTQTVVGSVCINEFESVQEVLITPDHILLH